MSDQRYLVLTYDTLAMRKESCCVDTNQVPDYNKRIEYQILNSQLQLLRLNVNYYRWGFLPNISAFINYNFVYQNEEFHKLYSQNFPNSFTGVRAVVPIFTGFRRIQNLQKAKLQQRRLELDQDYFKAQVQSEYQVSLGVYKANLYDYGVQEEILRMPGSNRITKFQYDQGIKTYLDV